MTAKQALTQARGLIQEKRYEEARSILIELDHPTAQEWLEKLDRMPQPLAAKSTPKTAASAQKGSVVQQYGLNKTELTRRLLIGVLAIPVFLSLLTFFPREFRLDTNTLLGIALPTLFLFGALSLLLPALAALIGSRQTTIYSSGVERRSLFGTIYVPWDELEGVKGGLTTYRKYGITLYTSGAYNFYTNGRVVFQVTNLDADSGKLYSQLSDAIVRTHKDKLLARFKRGEVLKFEAMEIHMDGLHFGRSVLPRHEISDVRANQRMIFIMRQEERVWKSFSLESAYNPWLFMEVVNAIAGV